jgi:hypothetical protein
LLFAADALSSSSSEFGSSAKDAASDAADKVKSAIQDAISAVPNSLAMVADQNADVRGLAQNYRDPAGAIQQDKATGGWLAMMCCTNFLHRFPQSPVAVIVCVDFPWCIRLAS